MKAEEIKPYDENRDKGEQVEQMFDSIAPAYDFMNAAMTFGLYRIWRNRAVSRLLAALPDVAAPHILDIACGTGDVTLHIARTAPRVSITGVDLSAGMLEVAERKLKRLDAEVRSRIDFVQADALHLPFADGSFHGLTVAYGVRNFQDLPTGLREMRRVLAPGAPIVVLELCEPALPLLRPGYRFYSRHIIPLAGRLVSRDTRAYSYLPESIAACPQRGSMTALMEQAGFRAAACRVQAPGVCAIYTAKA